MGMPDTDRVYPERVEGMRCRVRWSERLAEYKTHTWAEERCVQMKLIVLILLILRII